MLHSRTLESARAGRIPLPPGLFRHLLRAHRSREQKLRVIVADRLAPAYPGQDNGGPQRYEAVGGTIPDVVKPLLHFTNPDLSGGPPIVTMAPDRRDRKECPPKKINEQWWPLIDQVAVMNTLTAPWAGHRRKDLYSAIDRHDFYALLLECDYIVHTQDAAPYANLAFSVVIPEDGLLASIPEEIDSDLAVALSLSGHAHRMAVVPKQRFDRSSFNPAAHHKGVRFTTSQMLRVLSQVWLADQHDQAKDSPVKRPLCLCAPHVSSDEQAAKEVQKIERLADGWSSPNQIQHLNQPTFASELSHPRTIVVIETEDDLSGASFLMVNWISGHSGGF